MKFNITVLRTQVKEIPTCYLLFFDNVINSSSRDFNLTRLIERGMNIYKNKQPNWIGKVWSKG